MGKGNYFSGWYYKQEKGDRIIAFIPSWYCDGEKYGALIQVIAGEENWTFSFPAEELRVCQRKDRIRIGKNFFSPEGIRVDLCSDGDGGKVTVQGKLRFTQKRPLRYDIMGPFALLPFLQCRHGVVSMSHRVEGRLRINGTCMDLNGALGYAEKDRGSSFPSGYFWCHCGWREENACSLMAAVADIPFFGGHFKGCIAVFDFNGKQYRLATYLGARIRRHTGREIWLKQKDLDLLIQVKTGRKGSDPGLCLKAQRKGKMERTIRERPVCTVRVRFWRKGRLIADHIGRGSVEAEI